MVDDHGEYDWLDFEELFDRVAQLEIDKESLKKELENLWDRLRHIEKRLQ